MKNKLNKKLSGNFTTVMNYAMNDPRLSYKAIGLYCQMLSYPNDWEFSIRYLAKIHKDSRDSVATALNELLKYGYVTKSEIQNRKTDGSFGCYEYTVYQDARENPDYIPYTQEDINAAKAKIKNVKAPCTEKPCTEKPVTGNPFTENPSQINNIYINTFLTKEEEDTRAREKTGTVANPKLDVRHFDEALTNVYFNIRYSNFGNKEFLEAWDSSMSAFREAVFSVDDENLIETINTSSSEYLSNLLIFIYEHVFAPNIRSTIRDPKAYIRRMVLNYFYSSDSEKFRRSALGVE